MPDNKLWKHIILTDQGLLMRSNEEGNIHKYYILKLKTDAKSS